MSNQSTKTAQEIIRASQDVKLHDEEPGKETYKIGIHTLEEMRIQELEKVSGQVILAGKFLVTLGSEPAITPLLVKAQLGKWPSMKVLQIDAQVMQQTGQDPEWFVKVVDDLPEHVYFSIHIDGMNLDELRWQDLMNLTRELTYRRNIVGLDLIASVLQNGQALFGAKLLYKILCLIFCH